MPDRMSQYGKLGVDSRKGSFGKSMTAVSPEAFPHAFCKIYINNNTGYAVAQHGDGVGSKSVQRYLHYKETGDPTVFQGDADDCIEMNLGDIACSGLKPVMFTDNIAINDFRVPKQEYLNAINQRMAELLRLYQENDMPFVWAGGETADLPDQVRTIVFDGTITARSKKENVITGELIAPGDEIFGLASGGACKLEGKPNSGIMSNGSTLARHCLMAGIYGERYPEIVDDSDRGYSGRYMIDSQLTDDMTVSEAIISPTRHFSIIVNKILKKLPGKVHGVVLNTGGGQTKCTRIGLNIHYVKNTLPEPDTIFGLIMTESGEQPIDMYNGFNMGIGVDVIGSPEIESSIRDIASEYGINSQRTGYCDHSDDGNRVTIKSNLGEFEYEQEK